MSMADDSTSRSYRSNDPYRRGAQSSGEQADPLAELARLIGPPDPLPGSGRSQQRRPDAYEERTQGSDWRRTAAQMPAYETYPEEPGQETSQRYRDEAPPRRQRRPDPYFAAAEPPFARREPYQ